MSEELTLAVNELFASVGLVSALVVSSSPTRLPERRSPPLRGGQREKSERILS
jgi:hypothetical protein